MDKLTVFQCCPEDVKKMESYLKKGKIVFIPEVGYYRRLVDAIYANEKGVPSGHLEHMNDIEDEKECWIPTFTPLDKHIQQMQSKENDTKKCAAVHNGANAPNGEEAIII